MTEKISFTAACTGIYGLIAVGETPECAPLIRDPRMVAMARVIASEIRKEPGERWDEYSRMAPAELIARMDEITPGLAPHYAARKHNVETEAVRAVQGAGMRQLVVLGAGFDTLAARMAARFPALSCFELDLPATSLEKRRIMQTPAMRNITGALPNLAMLEADLSHAPSLTETLAPRLDSAKPTFFVAEGLTMYLSEAENLALLESLSTLSPKHRLCIGYMNGFSEEEKKFVGTESYKFSLPPKDAPAFFKKAGLKVNATRDGAELQTRLWTRYPDDPAKQAAYEARRRGISTEVYYTVNSSPQRLQELELARRARPGAVR